MSRGFGNTGRSPKIEPGGGGTVTGADNGLSLVGTVAELGGTLLHASYIELDNFFFAMGTGGTSSFSLDDTNQQYTFGPSLLGNQMHFFIEDNLPQTTLRSNGSQFLRIFPNSDFTLGDMDNAATGVMVFLNDSSGLINLHAGNNSNTEFIIDDSNELFQAKINTKNFFSIDGIAAIYQIGDLDTVNNGTGQTIDDNSQSLLVFTSGGTELGLLVQMDPAAREYSIGDIGLVGNGTSLAVNDTAQRVAAGMDVNSNPGLLLDFLNRAFWLGDPNGFGNSNSFLVDDTNQVINATANNGFFITYGGAGAVINFTNAATNGAGASVGTLTNAPAAGNPTKWIPITDGGVTRHIPAW